jgi:ribonuclease G
MSKELFVSSTPHETKVAIVEEDQLTEVYYERENEYTLAGSIYKGRVTRVLPGMQSAFVNVGLERDAFLYVSDFLLEEEDDAEAMEQVVSRSRPEVHVVSEPRGDTHHRPLEAEEDHAAPDAFDAEGAEEPSAEGSAEAGPGGAAEDREGTRRWRGRRRRGRGRDRFQERGGERTGARGPERSAQERGTERAPDQNLQDRGSDLEAEGAVEEGLQENAVDLTEEHGVEQNTQERSPERAPERPERSFDRGRDRGDRGRDRGRSGRQPYESRPFESSHERDAAPAAGYEPIVLPGESISKYQPPSAQKEQEHPAAAVPSHRPKPSTEYVVDASQFSAGSMTLPGESISKYKHGDQPAPVVAATPASVEPEPLEYAEHTADPVPRPSYRQRSAAPAAEPEAEAASAGHDDEAVSSAAQEHDAQESHHAALHHSISESEPAAAEPAKEAATHEPGHVVSSRDQDRFEKMNVASIFGGEAVDASDEPDQSSDEQTDEESRQETESLSAIPAAERQGGEGQGSSRSWHNAPRGVVEEEEIEEEESELLSAFEEHLDAADFDDLEEEEMGPSGDQMVSMGGELTDAVRDAHVNEHATGQYESEGMDSAEDFEESEGFEGAGEAGGEDDEDDEGDEEFDAAAEGTESEGARAEARSGAGSAGYQQRTDRRGNDRRNRKVGRRMRGRPRPHVQRHLPAISDLLKEGQEILVQIAKEPIAKKGARITSHIALPGRFLVYMPTVHHTGVSRKIASEEERQKLKRIVLSERGDAHGGFIVRTAASGASEEDLRADIRFLINLWNEIRGRAEKSKAPSLIYHDLNLVERILRDQVTVNFSSIWVDTEQEYERVLRFVSRFQPSLVKRVKLYTKDTPLFEQFSIAEEINKALKSKVWLKSGGYIVINQTEALVAIDVNTGKYVGKTARLEDTIVKTNIDAIKEIVRQIRLRDLGGIIVIDFIDMDERRNRQKVMQALEEALKADRAPSKVLQFNDFGLVAITRKRVKQSLERTLGQQCTVCTGTGMIKSVTTVCNEIYVEMRKMARHFEHDVMLRVNPEVAKALKANNTRWLEEMEELTRRTILVKSDPLLHTEQFDIQ